MKKLMVLVLSILLLSGCAARETFETVDDVLQIPAAAQMSQIMLELPWEAAAAAWESDAGQLYLCDGYCITVQILEAGDLDQTLCQLTGFHREELAVVQTGQMGLDRFDCVWSAMGEGDDQIGRAVVLSDGNYHYCLTLMCSASDAQALAEDWELLIASFAIA